MENAEKKLVGKRGVKDWAAGERNKEVKRKKDSHFQYSL